MLTLQGAFTSGELAPTLTARVDFSKYGQGCRTLKNVLVQPHGGAIKRPGFLLIDELPGEAALLPFSFNSEQSYCLVFGEYWFRVAVAEGLVKNGSGNPYVIGSPYTLAQAKTLSFAQSGDVLFLACAGIVPYKLKRYAHNNWAFEAMNFSCPIAPPAWESRVDTQTSDSYTLAYKRGQAYEYISESRGWDEEYTYSKNIDKDLYTKGSTTVSNTVNAVQFIHGAVKSDGSDSPAKLVTPYTYVVTSVNEMGKESTANSPAAITGPASNSWQSGDYIQVVWKAVPGAVEYRVYRGAFNGTPGFVGATGNTSYNDYNTAAVSTQTPPKWTNPFPSYDYPAIVGFFEQRLVFGSTPNRPQTIWFSRSGDYDNFSASTPLRADDSLEMTIASNEVSTMQWLVSLRSLILGASGMEWEVGSAEGAFSAKTAKVSPQSYRGSAALRALVIGNAILHVTRSGREVRDLKYDFGSDSYGGSDRTILAGHLFAGKRITSWTYQPAPNSVVWVVRDDGVLLGLTFQPEHEVFAWHRHHTDGSFLRVCSVPTGKDDRLFVVTSRNGRFFLEILAPAFEGTISSAPGCVYLDCALTHSGGAISTVGNLWHLEGKTVGILANGAVQAPRKVSGGKIVLDSPATTVVVGLPYTADLETMPVEVTGQEGASVGRKKYINAVNVLFANTAAPKVGCSFSRLEEPHWRTTEKYGNPPALHSGTYRVIVPELARNEATVCIRSDVPLPMAVLAVMPEVEVK